MKRRTLNYIRKAKARNIFQHVMEVDLKTFLAATLDLSQNFVVKKHVQNTLYSLTGYGNVGGMRA